MRTAAVQTWNGVEKSIAAWYVASVEGVVAEGSHVRMLHDLSGNGRHAHAQSSRGALASPPSWSASEIEGRGALVFDGHGGDLKTGKFAAPLEQPLTLMVVARATGDTTIVDSLEVESDRFELCHGFPIDHAGAPSVCITACGAGRSPPRHLLRGHTRSEGTWKIYTAIWDGDRSEIYVDGVLECGGKGVGSGKLDGLKIGGDHTGTYGLRGAIAELRLFSAHLAPGPRAQMEASLALRYGLTRACVAAEEGRRARAAGRR